MGFTLDIFTQIRFGVLVGPACKNASLIVEFAKLIQDRDGKDRFTAAVEACRLRAHPIRATVNRRGGPLIGLVGATSRKTNGANP